MTSPLDKIREKLSIDTLLERTKREVLSDEVPPQDKAVLLYQLGKLEELFNKDQGEAARQYLLAYKQDPTFVLPVIAAGSILFSTKSYERLLRLYEMARESVADAGLRSAILMFLFECVEGLGQSEGLEDLTAALESAKRYPVHALALQEWCHLAAGREEAACAAAERWKVVTEHPYVRAHFCLELARHSEALGKKDLAVELLREAAYNGRDFFPTIPELLRAGAGAADPSLLEEAVVDDISMLVQGGDPSARFLLARPASGQEAAVMMANMLATLAGVKGVTMTEAAHETLFGIVSAAIKDGKVPEVTSLLMELSMGPTSGDKLSGLIETAVQKDLEPVEKAWLYWSLVKVDLLAGRSDKAIENIKQIRKLGFTSKILDSLISLLHLNLQQQDEMIAYLEATAGEERRDVVADALLCDLKWAFKNDVAGVAERLRGYEKFSYGMEDIAYVAAVLTDNSFLKEKALLTMREGADRLLGPAGLMKFYAFEWPNAEKFLAAAEAFSPASRPLAVWASLLGFMKASESGRSDKAALFLKNVAVNVSASVFFPFIFKQWAQRLLGLDILQDEPRDLPTNETLMSAMGHHALLTSAADPRDAPAVGQWIIDQLTQAGATPFPATLQAHAARTVQRAGGDPALGAKLNEALLTSSVVRESLPDLTMALVLKQKDLGKILETLNELTGLFDTRDYDKPQQVALNIMKALASLFIEKDARKAAECLQANRTNGRLDAESMFMLMFTLPQCGLWNEWIDLWAGRPSGHGDAAEGRYETDVDRACMLARLALTGGAEGPRATAGRILEGKKGDPASLLVHLYGDMKARDRREFMRTLRHFGLWIGDPRLSGKMAFHVNHLALMEGRRLGPEDEPISVPDIVNMDAPVASVVDGGLINLTDEAALASLEGLSRLADPSYKCAGLVELGEFFAGTARPREALRAFDQALTANPSEIGAILGILRTARALDDFAMTGKAMEYFARITAGPKRAASRFVEAAEQFKKLEDRGADVIRCYEKAFELDPSNDLSFHGLIGAIEKTGNLTTLIPLIERRVGTISEYKELQMLLLKLADLKRQAKDMDGALVAVEDLLLITPEEADEKIIALRLKMDLLIQMNRIDQALDTGSQIVTATADKKVRKGILQKCINLAFQKQNMPEKGLGFCLKLIEEGEADQEFINKTLRIALKLEKWDDAARIQDLLAAVTTDEKEKIGCYLKKAEIYLRYAKDLKKAEEEYKKILRGDAGRWEALTRWQAARGARQLTADEINEFIDGALAALDVDPLGAGALNTLIRANRILMSTQTARYYEGIQNVLSASAARKIPTPPGVRSSMTMIGKTPSGTYDIDDLEGLFEPDAKMRTLNEVLRALSSKSVAALLQKEGLIRPDPAVEVADPSSPAVKFIDAWVRAFGVDEVRLFQAKTEDALLHSCGSLPAGIVLGGQAIFPLQPAALFRLGSYLFNMRMGLWIANLVEPRKVQALTASLVRLCSGFDVETGKEESLADMLFTGVDDSVKAPVNAVLEHAEPLTKRDLRHWSEAMAAAAMKAGHLVSGRIESLIELAYPGFRSLEEMSAEQIEALFRTDPAARETLRFAVSRRYEAMRQAVGLEL